MTRVVALATSAEARWRNEVAPLAASPVNGGTGRPVPIVNGGAPIRELMA
mgnify:CR=1 FL=1